VHLGNLGVRGGGGMQFGEQVAQHLGTALAVANEQALVSAGRGDIDVDEQQGRVKARPRASSSGQRDSSWPMRRLGCTTFWPCLAAKSYFSPAKYSGK
jgi:hypothetical protein